MDITIETEAATLTTSGVYRRMQVELQNVNENDLNSSEIAKHIDMDTYFSAHNERDIFDYIKHNYDWFQDDFKGF